MSRTLTSAQSITPSPLNYIATIGSLFASTEPGQIVSGQLYDLELISPNISSSLSVVVQSSPPTASFDIIGAVPSLGDAVSIYSVWNDADPLIEFVGIVGHVTERASGSHSINCTHTTVVNLPRAQINGQSTHVPVGSARIEPQYIRETNYDLVDGTGWGIKSGSVSSDATVTDVLKATGQAATTIAYATVPNTYSQTTDNSELLAVQFTLATDSFVNTIGIYVGGQSGSTSSMYLSIYTDSAGSPGSPIHTTPLLPVTSSVALVEGDINAAIASGNYWLVGVLAQSPTFYNLKDIGVDNGLGDAGRVTKLSKTSAPSWTTQSFDMGFKVSIGSNSVEWFLNAGSLGIQPWGTDIFASGGDIFVSASEQFGSPVATEDSTLTVAANPKVALGSQWSSRQVETTAFHVETLGVETEVPVFTSDIATIPTGSILTTTGPSFTPAVTAVASALYIYNVVDSSASGDQTIQIRVGSGTGEIVGSGILLQERITANRWVTVTLDAATRLQGGTAYHITSSQTGLTATTNAGLVKALTLTEANDIIDSVTVRTGVASHVITVPPLQAELRNSGLPVSKPNDVREYMIGLSSVTLDSVSDAAIAARDVTSGIVVGGLIQSLTVAEALAEIDRHTRTMSASVGDKLYLVDGDATPSDNITPDDIYGLDFDTADYGSIITRVAYSYAQGAENGTAVDSTLEASLPVNEASLSLNLLPDATQASLTAIWRRGLNGEQRSTRNVRISDMAAVPGDVIDISGTDFRIKTLRVGAPNEIEAVEA